MHFFYQDNTSLFILISLLGEAYIYSFDLFDIRVSRKHLLKVIHFLLNFFGHVCYLNLDHVRLACRMWMRSNDISSDY